MNERPEAEVKDYINLAWLKSKDTLGLLSKPLYPPTPVFLASAKI
jgi:hypothetical protein